MLFRSEALYDAGVTYNPKWVRFGDWERPSGHAEAGALIEEGVTAIYCMADRMAGGVYDYLEEHDIRVGEDISVIGFDNQDIAEYFRPALTTTALPLAEIGRKSAEILLKRLDEEWTEPEKEEIVEIPIPCKFIERKSVRKIN